MYSSGKGLRTQEEFESACVCMYVCVSVCDSEYMGSSMRNINGNGYWG